jgi:hypothetical protein
MENTAHALLGSWESFYVIVGSSAAALTGLQFVVIALVADMPGLRSAESVAAFGTPTVVHFCLTLFVSALFSAPWHSLTPVRWLLLAAGLHGLIYTGIVLRRARRQTNYQPVAEDWTWHIMLPLAAYGALMASAILLTSSTEAALFLAAGVGLLLIFIGIHNAWDTVSYVATQQRTTHKK